MPNLTDLFKIEDRAVQSGVIASRGTGDAYSVYIAGRKVTVRSTLAETLRPGDRVVVARADDGAYIAGKVRHYTNQSSREVVIDG